MKDAVAKSKEETAVSLTQARKAPSVSLATHPLPHTVLKFSRSECYDEG